MKLRPGTDLRVHGVLLLIQFTFATLPVGVKIAQRDLASPSIALVRVVGAAALFIPLQLLLTQDRIRGRADWGRCAVYSIFGVVLNQLLYITALRYTTATAAQMLITVGPAMTLVVGLALRRDQATLAKWFGIALASGGALSVIGAERSGGSLFGNSLVLANVASFSVYQVLSKDMLRRQEPLAVITAVFALGAIALAPWGAVALAHETGGISLETVLALVWVIMIPTVLSYYLHLWALQRASPSLVAIYVCAQPLLTALVAAPLLGERPSSRLVPAALLIFAGVALTGRAEGRIRRAQTAPDIPLGRLP